MGEEGANNVSKHALGGCFVSWKSNGDALEESHAVLDIKNDVKILPTFAILEQVKCGS